MPAPASRSRPKPRPSKPSAAKTYWILGKKQLAALTSARRLDILDRLAASGPSSVREFAGGIGMAPSAVYHHLRRLERAGLVVEAGTRRVGRRVERVYRAAAPRMRLMKALGEPEHRKSLARVVRAMTRQMDRDFALALRREGTRSAGKRRNLGFFRLVGAPGPRELERINAHLAAIAEILWTSPAGPRRTSAPPLALAWTLTPVGRPPAGRSKARARRSRR
jgi:DNA-binding transcriptional ArsR family regulator